MSTESQEISTKRVPKAKVKRKSARTYDDLWEIFHQDVAARPNFKKGHSLQLDILCKLYLELDHLDGLIKDEGYTYSSEGRYGLRVALNPNIQQRLKVQAEIRAYSKLLGITLHKDAETNEPKDDNEWE